MQYATTTKQNYITRVSSGLPNKLSCVSVTKTTYARFIDTLTVNPDLRVLPEDAAQHRGRLYVALVGVMRDEALDQLPAERVVAPRDVVVGRDRLELRDQLGDPPRLYQVPAADARSDVRVVTANRGRVAVQFVLLAERTVQVKQPGGVVDRHERPGRRVLVPITGAVFLEERRGDEDRNSIKNEIRTRSWK